MSNFLGKLKDIIGGGQLDYQYYEQEMESISSPSFQAAEDNFDSFSEAKGELAKPSMSHDRFATSEQSLAKMEHSTPSYKNNVDNNGSNDFPSNVIGMPGVNNMVNEVVVIEPHSFDEVPQVIQTLKEQRSVVLNLNIMEAEEAQRAVDFIAGGTYAIDGHQERIGESIFLFTPRNVKVSTLSGKSYKNNSETSLSTENFSKSFTESLWDDESLVNSHLAQ